MLKTLARYTLLIGSVALFASACTSSDGGARVKIANGTLVGTVDQEKGIRIFKGIPFAQPPVGDLRWREPQPVENWKGDRPAAEFGAQCMQPSIFDDMVFRASGMSEDCLYLNVWTPAKSSAEKLPVLVYIYGGGFVAGDGSEPRYDGASMAQKGIVTVTLNYRLGVLGMMAHPELTQESPNKASGNYTLLDQHAALEWVQQNIAAFGGDPKRVTIAGESAGSFSVSAQMASPLSRDLIAGAIGESGAMMGYLMPLSAAEESGTKFAEAVGASSLAELRALPAERILEASKGLVMPPVIADGYFFPKSPIEIYTAGEQASVPLLAGTNSLESWFGAILQGQEPTVENYQNAVKKLYGEHAERVASMYPAASTEQVMEVATELASDRFLSYDTWKWVDQHSQTSRKPAFYYYYTHPRPALRANPDAPVPNGAVHSAEIEYAMGNLDLNEAYAWTEDDYNVSRIMQQYFVNFIKTGDPNGEGLPTWSAYYSDSTHPRLIIDANTRLGPDTRRTRYQMLNEIGPPR